MEETKKGSGTTDLTVGRPLPQILKFALPLVLGTLFQQLYSFVDTVIVGRCLGTDALGAVGTTYSLNFLILGFVLGSCTGFGIPVAQSFGARDSADMHKYLFNGAVLCVVLSVVFTIVTTLIAAPLLRLIHTPAVRRQNTVSTMSPRNAPMTNSHSRSAALRKSAFPFCTAVGCCRAASG